MHSRKLVTILATLLLSIACAQAANTAGEASSENGIPIEVYGGYLIVAKVEVANLKGLRFLVDTGASDTVIDRKAAERLGVTSQPAKLINFDKTLELDRAEVPEINFGPEHMSSVPVLIEDLGNLRPDGRRLDGVLGLDQLRRTNFVMDYAKKRMIFGAAEHDGMRSVPMRLEAQTLTVEAEIDGQPVRMIADSGAPGAVFYEDSLRNAVAHYRIEERIASLSLGGPVESHRAFVPRFRLGSQDLDREVVVLSTPGSKIPIGISGYLGLASLNAREIDFDFVTDTLSWKR
jgi:hypothetical protein